MKTREKIGIIFFIIFGLLLFIAPAIIFTQQLRNLYSYEHTTNKIYIITQLVWIGIVFFFMLIFQDRSKKTDLSSSIPASRFDNSTN